MLRRVAGICGIASQLVVATALLVTTSNSPWFNWSENYISVLGVEGSMAMLFNWGLILAGVLSVIFAIGLRKNLVSSRLGQLGMVSLILGSIGLSGMGIFPRIINLPHNLASIAFFVFVTSAIFLIGIATITASQRRWGVISLTAGVLTIILQLIPWSWSGGAIPQVLYCLPWSLWTVVFGLVLLVKSSPIDVKSEG